MNIIKGNIDEQNIFDTQDLDITNCTHIYLKNNGSVTAYFGNRKIEAGKEADMPFGFVVNNQIKNIRFDDTTGTKELYIMLSRAIIKCN